MFEIRDFDQYVFNAYFTRTASYEGWMFYFSHQQSQPHTIRPFAGFGFSPDTFAAPPLPWDALMFYDGDSGALWQILPINVVTDGYLAALRSSGKAVSAG